MAQSRLRGVGVARPMAFLPTRVMAAAPPSAISHSARGVQSRQRRHMTAMITPMMLGCQGTPPLWVNAERCLRQARTARRDGPVEYRTIPQRDSVVAADGVQDLLGAIGQQHHQSEGHSQRHEHCHPRDRLPLGRGGGHASERTRGRMGRARVHPVYATRRRGGRQAGPRSMSGALLIVLALRSGHDSIGLVLDLQGDLLQLVLVDTRVVGAEEQLAAGGQGDSQVSLRSAVIATISSGQGESLGDCGAHDGHSFLALVPVGCPGQGSRRVPRPRANGLLPAYVSPQTDFLLQVGQYPIDFRYARLSAMQSNGSRP